MNGKYLMGIDIGTSSVKVAIIDENGKPVGITSGLYRLYQEAPGCRQIDADDLWRACLECIGRLKLDHGIDLSRLAGIGISCLCPGLSAHDRDGKVLVNPIIYSDQRSVAEAEQIKAAVGEERLFELTANHVMAGAMSGTSMLWIKNHLPEIYENTYSFGHVNTMMAVRLTGNFAIDRSNASYTSLFETGGGYRWSDELCRKIGIDKEKLPPLLKSHEVVGELRAREFIGIGIPKGIPVVIGGGDTACASLAAGVIRAGEVCESVGTTDVLTVCVTEPRFDRAFINRCHVVDDCWIYQGALSHTGASLRWMRDEFCQDLKMRAEAVHDDAYNLMTALADRNSRPGAGGIVFLPYMLGERSPVWDSYARGVFFGISLHSRRADFIRAVLEGAGYGLRQLCELTEQVTGRPIKEFYAIGGGARNIVWSQIKADITGKDIVVLDVNEMAPIGAALLAGVGIGCFKDVYEASGCIERTVFRRVESKSAHAAVYNKRYDTYRKLYPQLKELYRSNY